MVFHSMHKNMWIAEFMSLSLLCLLYLFNLCTVCIFLTQLHGQYSDVVPRNVLPVKRSCSHQRSWCNVDIKEPPWITAPVNWVSARAHVKNIMQPLWKLHAIANEVSQQWEYCYIQQIYILPQPSYVLHWLVSVQSEMLKKLGAHVANGV